MTLEQIIEQNYQVTHNRGLITDHTNARDFVNKIREEVAEVEAEPDLSEAQFQEVADVILTCLNYFNHFGVNAKAMLEIIISKNKNRVK